MAYPCWKRVRRRSPYVTQQGERAAWQAPADRHSDPLGRCHTRWCTVTLTLTGNEAPGEVVGARRGRERAKVASGIGFGNRKKRGYRKRRPLPLLIFVAVLAVVAMFVWVRAIMNRTDIDELLRCTPAPVAPAGTTLTPLGHGALDQTAPVPPDRVAVRVLNASNARGQATITTEALRELGFTKIGTPDIDPEYQDNEPKCRGQLRFGDEGMAAARTVSLVVPCVEFIKDSRQDASVDLSIGGSFGDVRPTNEARQALQQLQGWAATHPGDGNDQSAGTPPALDPNLLTAARNVSC
jgi:hypothetical protein